MEKKNRSVTYLLPLTLSGLNCSKSAIINSYVYNISAPEFNSDKIEGLFIVWSYEEESKDSFIYNPRCCYMQEINENFFITYIKAPVLFIPDLNLICNSKYSKISDDAKKVIANYYSLSMSSKQMKILTNDVTLRKQIELELGCELDINAELGEAFDLTVEIFDNKKISIA